MEEEKKDAIEQEETSPVQDEQETSESSTEETQPEEATSQEAVEGKPFNEHPRFKELISEKNELKENNDRLQQQLLELSHKALTPQEQKQKVEENIYEANTPEEKRFWQTVEKVADSKIATAVKKAEQNYQQQIKGYQAMVGNVIAKDFLKSHTEVEKNSPEMKSITEKAQKLSNMGMDVTDALEMAYKDVMFDKNAKLATETERKKHQQKNQQKLQANVEQKTIPETVLNKNSVDDIYEAARLAEKETGQSFGG